jgi:membrane associated rhomboid family serine protease
MFIPIGDDNSRRRRIPFVVWLIVLVNSYVWFQELQFGELFIASFAAIPFELTTGTDLITTKYITAHGTVVPVPQGPGPSPIYLTLISSMFMHGSWLHIIGNMVYLLVFGDQIEDRLGHIRFLIFYLFAGIVAGVAQVLAEPYSVLPCVGASGAIAGVLGAYLMIYPGNPIRVLLLRSVVNIPAALVLGFWGVLQVLGHLGNPSPEGGVAYMAHLGGFGIGVLTGLGLRLMGKKY